MKSKDLIQFIKKSKMENKEICCLITQNNGVWAQNIDGITLSCPEDNCVFLNVNLDKKEPFEMVLKKD